MMDVFWTYAERFLDRYGVAVFVLLWFMLRQDRRMDRLISKVNRMIIGVHTIAMTLNLDEEQKNMAKALADVTDSKDGE